MQSGSTWTRFGHRIVGAVRLRTQIYQEISRDRAALAQAVAVILLTSLASAIVFLVRGSAPGLSVDIDWGSYPITRESNIAAAVVGAVLDGGWGLLIWAAQAAIVWWLWNRFSRNQRSWPSIAAPLGFANAPLIVFAILEAIPMVGGVLGAVGLIWMLIASIVALRATLATGWGRSILLLLIAIGVLIPFSIAVSRIG